MAFNVVSTAINYLDVVSMGEERLNIVERFSRFVGRGAPVGEAPGTVTYVGEERTEPPSITVIDYDMDGVREDEVDDVEEAFPYRDEPSVTWINVNGVHEPELIQRIGEHFGIHTLIQEDIANTEQRPKIEYFEDHIFVALKMLTYNEEERLVKAEHVSMVIGSNVVVSFQETSGDVFDPVRERIRNGRGRIRRGGPDFLAYVLIDTIVDNYFDILEQVGEDMERIEEELMDGSDPETLKQIHQLKQEMLYLRRSVWPLREVVSTLERDDHPVIAGDTEQYFRDVYDHTIQVIDIVETYRDMLSSMTDLYLSVASNRMNEVMKVLTIMATIFIPLTFIAGVYGMNFEYMPELTIWWAYPAVLGVMGVVALMMIAFFRHRDWL